MSLFARIVPNTIKATVIFTAVTLVMAMLAGGTAREIVARVMTELPPLLTLSAAFALAINLVAATGGAIIGGSALIAAATAAAIGWAAAHRGLLAFSKLDYGPHLAIALVVALAIPWLLGGSAASD